MIKPIPVVEDFGIETEVGWNGAFLVCPAEGCPGGHMPAPDSLGEALDAARTHIEQHHLPPPPPLGCRRCPTCGELYADGPTYTPCPHCQTARQRQLDQEDGLFYAHQNGLDCGRRPCPVCAPDDRNLTCPNFRQEICTACGANDKSTHCNEEMYRRRKR